MKYTIEQIQERLDHLEYSLRKVRALLEDSVSAGITEFDSDLLFTEENYGGTCDNCIPKIIEHLLKMKYCTNERNHSTWTKDIKHLQKDVRQALRYGTTKGKPVRTNILNYVKIELNDSYYPEGIDLYTFDSEEWSDLPDIKDILPDECPWNIDDLITLSIDELICVLPEIGEE